MLYMLVMMVMVMMKLTKFKRLMTIMVIRTMLPAPPPTPPLLLLFFDFDESFRFRVWIPSFFNVTGLSTFEKILTTKTIVMLRKMNMVNV